MTAIIVAYVVIEAIAWLVFTALCGDNIYFNPVENYKTWDSLNWFGVWVGTIVYWIAFLPVSILFGIMAGMMYLFTVGRN